MCSMFSVRSAARHFSDLRTCSQGMIWFLCSSVYSHHLGAVIPDFTSFGLCHSGLIEFNDNYSFLKCLLNIFSFTNVILQ
jgi:hypothetical protein